MWIFNKKQTLKDSGILTDLVDIHSHILPDVDDGVKTTKEALSILDYYESLGIKKVALTPHIMDNIPQEVSDLKQRFNALKSDYNGNIELSLAAEYMIDCSFFELLEKGDLLTHYDNYLLVEMSYLHPVVDIFDCVKQIMAEGYFVILAHPERYLYLSRDDYHKLKDRNVKFQLNITSLFGDYGKSVEESAKWLLSSSYYDFIGSDIHRLKHHTKTFNSATLSKKEISALQAIKAKNIEL